MEERKDYASLFAMGAASKKVAYLDRGPLYGKCGLLEKLARC
jgi:hypothetical protein